MGNCLVTKLKENVNNDNLKKLGILTIDVLPRTEFHNYDSIFVVMSENSSAYIDGGFYYSNGTPDERNPLPITANMDRYLLPTIAGGKMDIYNKYAITTISLSQIMGIVELKDLEYCTGMTKIDGNFIGSLSYIEKMPSLIYFRCTIRNNITGNISDFVNAHDIETIVLINQSGVVGELTELATSLAPYRTNGSTLTITSGGSLKNSGVTIENGVSKTITFDGQGGYTIA